MNPQANLAFGVEDAGGFLAQLGVLLAIPDKFKPRSRSSAHWQLDGRQSPDQIVKTGFSGWTTIFESTSREEGGWRVILSEQMKEVAVLYVEKTHLRTDLLSEGRDASKALNEAHKRLTPYFRKRIGPGGVWVEFARMFGQGVRCSSDFLRCPRWKKIQENYPSETTARALTPIFGMKKPWENGRLMIWHGPPGTGKTYALRALMMEWRERFKFLVITDPENFTVDPNYYLEVASERSNPRFALNPCRRQSFSSPDVEEEENGEPEKKRVLFIMEDAADLIMQESRSKHFDKIGKLLNMTDGLFGQGREDVFLVTFNEDVEKIDPAFLRPGRCIADVAFDRFGIHEARGWLNDHGKKLAEDDAVPQTTLAELYARLRGESKPAKEARVGFGAV